MPNLTTDDIKILDEQIEQAETMVRMYDIDLAKWKRKLTVLKEIKKIVSKK